MTPKIELCVYTRACYALPRRWMVAGAARSLQNCWFHGPPWNGGFDSRALPPTHQTIRAKTGSLLPETREVWEWVLEARSMKKFILVFLVFLLFSGCGKKAAPKPIEKKDQSKSRQAPYVAPC